VCSFAWLSFIIWRPTKKSSAKKDEYEKGLTNYEYIARPACRNKLSLSLPKKATQLKVQGYLHCPLVAPTKVVGVSAEFTHFE